MSMIYRLFLILCFPKIYNDIWMFYIIYSEISKVNNSSSLLSNDWLNEKKLHPSTSVNQRIYKTKFYLFGLFAYILNLLPVCFTLTGKQRGADFKKQAYENAYQIASEIGQGIENRHLTIPTSALYQNKKLTVGLLVYKISTVYKNSRLTSYHEIIQIKRHKNLLNVYSCCLWKCLWRALGLNFSVTNT